MHGNRIIGALGACYAAAATFQINAAVPPAPDARPRSATATFVDGQGRSVGKATLLQTPKGVLIQLKLEGVKPGEHGFHIHEKGSCDPKTGFKSAGDHYTPRSTQHGYVRGGPHAGDMPNVYADTSGQLHADLYTSNVTMLRDEATLFDEDGSALVVHAKPDDYRSQPSGDAGDRIACAVIEAVPTTGREASKGSGSTSKR
jgi:Cu-Zn family superoxide dismutase